MNKKNLNFHRWYKRTGVSKEKLAYILNTSVHNVRRMCERVVKDSTLDIYKTRFRYWCISDERIYELLNVTVDELCDAIVSEAYKDQALRYDPDRGTEYDIQSWVDVNGIRILFTYNCKHYKSKNWGTHIYCFDFRKFFVCDLGTKDPLHGRLTILVYEFLKKIKNEENDG